MAQGRPISRHGRMDAFKRLPADESDMNNMYPTQDFVSARPKSGYKKRSEGADYDSFARVIDSRSQDLTPRSKPPPRPVSRRRVERSTTYRDSDSDENFVSSSPDGPLVSPKSPTGNSKDHQKQNRRKNSIESSYPLSPTESRPPTSGSMRPPSASTRRRSARFHHRDPNASQFHENETSENLGTPQGIRPSSSFSKYRPLPAIGTPTPPSNVEPRYLYNESPERGTPRNHVFSQSNLSYNDRHHQQSLSVHDHSSLHGRISSAVSDISVISTKANSSRKTSDHSTPAEQIERLDLSQLEKPSDNGRRRKPSANQSPCHKPKSAASVKSKFDAGDLYDGDDDDSDTNIDCVNTFVQGKKENSQNISGMVSTKEPVIIPSQHQPAASEYEQEILLAVKLPTNGTRHQRYFNRSEPLMSIVEFAEEHAGQDFAGYALVSSAPKNVYEDLRQTIEEAGLEDRSMLHLEEID